MLDTPDTILLMLATILLNAVRMLSVALTVPADAEKPVSTLPVTVDAAIEVAPCVPVTSPTSEPVKLPALPVTLPAIGFVTVKFPSAPTEVNDDPVTPAASVVPVNVPAGAITAAVLCAVTNPLPFVVSTGIAVDDPTEPEPLLTVAKVPVIAVVPLPDISPDSVIV